MKLFFFFFNLNLKILLYEILETSDLAFFWRKNYIKVYFYSIEVVFIQKIKFCRESYRLRIEKNIVEVSRVNRSWKWEIIRRENKVEIDIYSKRYLLYYLYCQFVWRLLNARINIYALRFTIYDSIVSTKSSANREGTVQFSRKKCLARIFESRCRA